MKKQINDALNKIRALFVDADAFFGDFDHERKCEKRVQQIAYIYLKSSTKLQKHLKLQTI